MIKRDPSRFLLIGFTALLVISLVQAAWWISDNVRYTRLVEQELAAVAADDTQVDATVAAAVAAIAERSDGRVNQYLWEGSFFIAVLIAGLVVLMRTIRHDAELRRRQQNFLAAVSHEFKSPLASMQLAAETLVMRSDDADSKRLGQRMLEDCERLLRMVDNLLDTTRIEEGRHELKAEKTPLDAVIPAIAESFDERAARNGITVTTQVTPGLSLTADATALEAMLRNLIDNALKACIAGKGQSIDISASVEDQLVRIRVSDDGLGFPPEESALMFEKFHRLGDELTRKTPGTGLGLYIVRRLAEQTGGSISAQSDGPGHGASMTLSWPQTQV